MIDFMNEGTLKGCGCGWSNTKPSDVIGPGGTIKGAVGCGCSRKKNEPFRGGNLDESGRQTTTPWPNSSGGYPNGKCQSKNDLIYDGGTVGCGADCDCEPCKAKYGGDLSGPADGTDCPNPDNYVSIFWVPFTIGATTLALYFGSKFIGRR